MKTKLLDRHADERRTFMVVLENGEEAMSALQEFVHQEGLSAAQVTAIGAFRKAVLFFFDWESKEYERIPVDEQTEVAALVGDVALGPDGEPVLHLHVVLGRRDGSALAGHLSEAHVRPTLEVVLTEQPAHLRRKQDPESGLPLIHSGS